MLLTLTPGVTYSFTFSTDFSARNGVYTLDKLSTYTEYLADGGNLYDEVFLPLNINPERMHQDMDQIESSKMMKLTTPDGIDNPVTIFMWMLILISMLTDILKLVWYRILVLPRILHYWNM